MSDNYTFHDGTRIVFTIHFGDEAGSRTACFDSLEDMVDDPALKGLMEDDTKPCLSLVAHALTKSKLAAMFAIVMASAPGKEGGNDDDQT